jgi:hypothetical protein
MLVGVLMWQWVGWFCTTSIWESSWIVFSSFTLRMNKILWYFSPFYLQSTQLIKLSRVLLLPLEKNSVTQIGYSTMHYLLGIHNNWWKWSDIAYTYKVKNFLEIHFEEVGNLVLLKICVSCISMRMWIMRICVVRNRLEVSWQRTGTQLV